MNSFLAFLVGLVFAAAVPVAGGTPVHHPVFPLPVTEAEVRADWEFPSAAEPPATAPDPAAVAALTTETARVMAFTRAQINAFIVPRTTLENLTCPNCDGGTSHQFNWKWSPEDPDHIVCKYCGMAFPNARYPMARETIVIDPAGTVQHYRYYQKPGGTYRYYFQMRVDNAKKHYMERQAKCLALLYAGTHDERYASVAAVILERLADVYVHYSVHGIENWETCPPVIYGDIRPRPVPPDGLQSVPGRDRDLTGYNQFPPIGKMAYPYCSVRRGNGLDSWFYFEMPPDLALAYDQVAASPAFDELSSREHKDVRKDIEDFFRATANYARTYPIYLGNMDPILIRDFAIIGRVIGEPEFVHDALRRARLLMRYKFYPDGLWYEGTPDYNAQVLSWLIGAVGSPLRGYSDPPGYINPIDHRHLANLEALKDLPHLGEAITALNGFRMPNGERITVHDAFSAVTLGKRVAAVGAYENIEDGSLAPAIDLAKPKPFGTRLYWAAGEAILGLGRGKDGIQADLHFGGGTDGHEHYDGLDLVLFGEGRELLPDIGYTHTIARPYAISSLAHNLVVVDARNQQPASGQLIGWGEVPEQLRFAEAADGHAYTGTVSTYRRALAVIALPDGGEYLLDVFRVAGGRQHDWMLHGSADFPQQLACTLPLQPDPDGLCAEPDAAGMRSILASEAQCGAGGALDRMYGLMAAVRSARTDGEWSATFRYAAPGEGALRTTVLGQPGTTVYCGALPAVRPAHEDNRLILAPQTPAIVVRRRGSSLASTFVAIHEPFRSDPRITDVRRLPLVAGGRWDVGVICRGDDFVDYYLSGSSEADALRTRDGTVSARGRFAFVRTRNGEAVAMILVDGTRLRFGDRVLTGPPAVTGTVIGTSSVDDGDRENALRVDTMVAPRAGRVGERVFVTFGDGSTYALAVRQIRTDKRGTVIVLESQPGFTVSADGQRARQTHFPQRAIDGPPRFRLPGLAAWTAR